MKKYLLFSGAAILGLCSMANAAVDCRDLPDCEEYGYTLTASDCAGRASLKCPFDYSKLFCVVKEPTGKNCVVGALLYDDLNCYRYTSAPSGKNAIGVVFDTTKRLAVLLTPPQKRKWGAEDRGYMVTDVTSGDYTYTSTDGQENTQILIGAMGSGTDTAAGYCYGLGGFLPSASELKTLYDNKEIVNNKLNSLPNSSTILISDIYWSSNGYGNKAAAVFSMDHGSLTGYLRTATVNTRCAVAY